MAIEPALKAKAAQLPVIDLTEKQCGELELLLSGALLPWTGYGVAENPAGQSAPPVRLVVAGAVPKIGEATLRDPEGALLAICDIQKTTPTGKGYEIVGSLQALEPRSHFDFKSLRHTISNAKETIAKRAWTSAIGVFVDSLPSEQTVEAVSATLANGKKTGIIVFASKSGDTQAFYAKIRGITKAFSQLPQESLLIVLLPCELDQAVRELVSKNYGAMHLLKLPSASSNIPSTILEEAKLVQKRKSETGFTVFFTGLSGSGKSTVARALQARLLEIGPREVTLLDGDVVRKNLSSELGFSKEHRNINILRIGYVASEITRHGGVAICCPIAPYDAIRKAVRAQIEPLGEFVLVAITTPLEVCEQRDRKGLYAKARAGIVKEFTGISDPYEMPTDADLYINTAEYSLETATETIVSHLINRGLLPVS